MWDPTTYLRYADERSRPFFDLVARINQDRPREVVDLGCGPGTLTVDLARRWPDARVSGLDERRPMTLRVTQVYCRTADGWRILHRHADAISEKIAAAAVLQ